MQFFREFGFGPWGSEVNPIHTLSPISLVIPCQLILNRGRFTKFGGKILGRKMQWWKLLAWVARATVCRRRRPSIGTARVCNRVQHAIKEPQCATAASYGVWGHFFRTLRLQLSTPVAGGLGIRNHKDQCSSYWPMPRPLTRSWSQV